MHTRCYRNFRATCHRQRNKPMKTRKLILISICLLTVCMTTRAESRVLSSAENPCELLRMGLRKQQESSVGPTIDVLFFDINHDGVPEALVAYIEDTSAGGLHGNDWGYRRFKDGEWQQGPLERYRDGWFDPNTVYARGDDFYSLREDGKKPKLILIYTSCSKDNGVTTIGDEASEIILDDKGFLKTIPVPELARQYIFDQEVPEDIDSIGSPEGIEMRKKLVLLTTEYFLPQKTSEDKNAPPVITAEAEIKNVVQDETQVLSTPSREKQLEKSNEEVEMEEPAKANHAWLYLALALCTVCAILYALWKKRR